ncbi:hypothetical protein BCR34DRAFT_359132 [Clohesyomyces aquaticus]|uniref:Uncharacterized protein n=1 Tax=Clohesyomyces aquaticus TaxID=1231657 RepID=A0A1Y1ZIB8_9PLEO|nr:hypothetical protein BCR34DRAFT_359132 [Clohesyomyces aquaticus]
MCNLEVEPLQTGHPVIRGNAYTIPLPDTTCCIAGSFPPNATHLSTHLHIPTCVACSLPFPSSATRISTLPHTPSSSQQHLPPYSLSPYHRFSPHYLTKLPESHFRKDRRPIKRSHVPSLLELQVVFLQVWKRRPPAHNHNRIEWVGWRSRTRGANNDFPTNLIMACRRFPRAYDWLRGDVS